MAGSSLLHQTPRNYKFVSHSIKIEDKYDLIKFIETVFLKLPPLGNVTNQPTNQQS